MVVCLSLFWILQDFIGLMYQVELIFGTLIIWIVVWVVFLSHPEILQLYLFLRGCWIDAKQLIVVDLSSVIKDWGSSEVSDV